MFYEHQITSGTAWLDRLVGSLRLGDNVVIRTDVLEEYRCLAREFGRASAAAHRQVVYFRFGNHPPIFDAGDPVTFIELDPTPGFDSFSKRINASIASMGYRVFYVFDSLSSLVEEWATDESLANFFQVTCPFLFQLETVAFFTLDRARHANATVARIEHTTQVLIDLFCEQGTRYVQVLKAQKRFWPGMYLPHRLEGDNCISVFQAAHIPPDTARSPWETVFAKASQLVEETREDEQVPERESLKLEAARMLLGQDAHVLRLAERYFELEDLLQIKQRLIGTGHIGGKATGMLLARKIIQSTVGLEDVSAALEDHDSFYVGSDVFFTFLVENHLFHTRLRAGTAGPEPGDNWDSIEEAFLAGTMPTDITRHLEEMLAYFGTAPIIVRSSSLLEDGFGNAFAGKYHSEFCPNQGTLAERLEALLTAMKRVYASTLNPDALAYRRKRQLEESDEQMGVLIQRVSGRQYQRWFFPTLAGVAFSRNLYAWNTRIDPSKGLIRLVFGLGTSAVNRVGGGYPRLVAISHPLLRPEIGVKIAKYSQHDMEAIDLEENQLATVPVDQILRRGHYPGVDLLVSLLRDEDLYEPFYRNFVVEPGEKLVLTFHNLLKNSRFIRLMDKMLTALESVYETPVDTEFTVSMEDGDVRINLLQCRPLWHPVDADDGTLDELPGYRLFETDKFMCGGRATNVRYILYIDPEVYVRMTNQSIKKSLGRVIGKINHAVQPKDGEVLLMGPGRWGSNNLELGVNVTYADINHVAVLVEIGIPGTDHLPEVSYGTHFFLDIVEGNILYMALFPHQRESPIFKTAANQLLLDFPQLHEFAGCLKWLDLERIAPGRRITVVASPRRGLAAAFCEGLCLGDAAPS